MRTNREVLEDWDCPRLNKINEDYDRRIDNLPEKDS